MKFQLILLASVLALSMATPRMFDLYEDGQVDANEAFSFKVALRQNNLDKVAQIVDEVSDPDHFKYGQHLSNSQIAQLVRLPEAEIVAVEEYFTSRGAVFCQTKTQRSPHLDYILVQSCVGEVHRMFEMKMGVYRAINNRKISVIRTVPLIALADNVELLLPAELHNSVEMILDVTEVPVNYIPVPPVFNKDTRKLTPNDVRKLYNVDPEFDTKGLNAEKTKGQAGQAVAEFEGAAFSASSLAQFQSHFNIESNPISHVVGNNSNGSPQVDPEANLDVQYISSIATGVDTWDFVHQQFDLVSWAIQVYGYDNAPRVHSVSYGAGEGYFGNSQMGRINSEFMKMAAQGFTIFVASGDEGPGLEPSNCQSFQPNFPGTSPYVTAVGGTYIDKNNGDTLAWSYSSGGFSNYFSRPSYQDAAVEAFLKNPNANTGNVTNLKGRAAPDVSAFGAIVFIVSQGGKIEGIGGTSAASPIFASMISMINTKRAQEGKSALGFLNPALYKLGANQGLVDVTLGATVATQRQPFECFEAAEKGFPAVAGWDPATGLGYPDHIALEKSLNGSEA